MSEKNAYRLINPYVEGSVPMLVRSKNSRSAGIKLYKNLSKFFTNHVEDSYITIQNVQTKALSHFEIKENGNKDIIDYRLDETPNNFPPDLEAKLIDAVEQLDQQSGGKHGRRSRKDDDSTTTDSSSSSDNFSYNVGIPIQPITRLTYFTLPYYRLNPIVNIVGVSPIEASRLFLPMFSLPINPVFEIRLDLYRLW